MFKWIETPDGLRFINPYNFVSLGSDVQRTEPIDGTLSGKIKINLIARTPLAIPDTEQVTVDNNEHKTFPFFRVRVGDNPVIPGSQLRGMLRSAYETLSNSCLSVNNNNILSARHANPGNPGLIQFKDGAWHLFDARTSRDNGQTISENEAVRRTWYTIDGKQLKTKIFRNTGDEIACANIEKAIENYLEDIKIYKVPKSAFQKYEPKLTYGIRKDGQLYPVYYEIVECEGKNYVYLSPSQMGRYVFDNRLDDLLGSHKSCAKYNLEKEEAENKKEDRKKNMILCKACALFGSISEGRRCSYASKLRFSDAQGIKFDSMGFVTLKELAGPKPTAVEFYTNRPTDSLYWTYDYKITSYKRVKLSDTQSQTVPQKEKCAVIIRGRKFYFHNPNLQPSDYQSTEKTKRNCTVELCAPHSRFSFDIYFERITEEQLHELLWTITIGENDENGIQMHKLSHGKPLGLGSVKLVVTELEIRSFDSDSLSYHIEHVSPEQVNNKISAVPFDTSEKAYKDFMLISKFDGLSDIMKKKKANICYPIADDGKGSKNSKASHQWFIANRSMGNNGTTTSWSVKYKLPVATSNNPTLPAMVRMDTEEIRELEMKKEKLNNNISLSRFKK